MSRSAATIGTVNNLKENGEWKCEIDTGAVVTDRPSEFAHVWQLGVKLLKMLL